MERLVSKSTEQKLPQWDLKKIFLHHFRPRLLKLRGIARRSVQANLQMGVILDLGVKGFWLVLALHHIIE